MTAVLFVQWNPEAQAWHMEARDSSRGLQNPPLFEGSLPGWLNEDAGDATLVRLASSELRQQREVRASRVVVRRPRVHAKPALAS